MSKIFISYKRADKEKVFKIKDKIESSLGEKCWIDIDGIESDAQFKNVIIKAINECEVVLFMYSKAHSKIVDFEKDWTMRELNFASKKNKRIVFVNIDGSRLSDAFEFDYGTKQQIQGNNEASVEKLIEDLASWLKVEIEIIPPVLPKQNLFSFFRRKFICPIYLGITFVCCVCSFIYKRDLMHAIGGTLAFMSFVFTVLVFFKKKLFGVNSIIQGISYFLAALFFSTVTWIETMPEETPQSQVCAANNGTGIDDGGSTCLIYNGDGKSASVQSSTKCIAVDLGLTSGTLWADRNIGANNEKDYGNHYSWGELKPKNDYRQSCYSDIRLNSIVGTDYDVCTAELGGDWQMPTQKQFDELIAECQWEWSGNGVTITGKTGKSILLPASGWSCSSIVEYRNQFGYYWTGDKVNDAFAKGLLFSKSKHRTGNGYLYYGRAVRAVKK